MKYIINNDKIYKVEIKGNFAFWQIDNGIQARISLNGLKQNYRYADTIEELCDEFILFDKQSNTYGRFDKKEINYKWLKEHINIYPSELCVIYGAIWAKKRLIYVAKMNDAGELVLI